MFGMKTTGLKRMIEMKISVHKRKEKTMGKQHWKPGNMLNPVPAVMVSVTDKEGKSNIITCCMGRYGMYESANGVDLRASVTLFLSDSGRDRRVCDQSYE